MIRKVIIDWSKNSTYPWGLLLFWGLLNIVIILILIALGLAFSVPNSQNCCVWLGSFFMTYLGSVGNPVLKPVGYAAFVRICGLVLFQGGIVAVLIAWISGWLNKARDGHVAYRGIKDHIVIFGDDETLPTIVAEVAKNNPSKKILIACTHPVSEIKGLVDSASNTLFSEKKVRKRIYYYQSEKYSQNSIKKLNTTKASKIYVVGDSTDPDHDADNMRIIHILSGIHKSAGCGSPIPLTMWFSSDTSFAAMQLNDIKKEWKELFEFRPYNFYMEWARRMFVTGVYRKGNYEVVYCPLDRGGIGHDSKAQVHLIVVGMTRMGLALAREAAQLLHFSNFDEKNPNTRSLITFIDDNADKELDYFRERYPGYFDIAPTLYWDAEKEAAFPVHEKEGNFLDIQFQFIKGRVESLAVKKWMVDEVSKEGRHSTIAICTDNSTLNMGIALHLPEEVHFADTYSGGLVKEPVNIYVRQTKTGSMVEALYTSAGQDDKTYGRYKHLRPFGMMDNSYEENDSTLYAAKLFNELYEDEEFRIDSNLSKYETAMHKHWSKLRIAHQWSNIYLVDSLRYKLNSIGTVSHNPILEHAEMLARMEHNRWNMERILLGFRRARKGELEGMDDTVRDKYQRDHNIHPSIKPFNDLEDEIKKKDFKIVNNIKKIYEIYEQQVSAQTYIN